MQAAHTVQYLIRQLSCRNMIRFKMADMLDFQKPNYWPICYLGCWFSITRPNMMQKVWSVPKLLPKKIQNFGCRSAAILNLFPMATFNMLSTLHYWPQPPYKILCQYLSPQMNYNSFLKIKMAAVCHVRFWKIWLLPHTSPCTVDFSSLYQIWCKNFDWRPNYGHKLKSKMAVVRHLGIVASSYRTTHEVFSLGHIIDYVKCPCSVLA